MVEIANPAVDVEIADVLLVLSRLLGWLVVVGLIAVVVALVYGILWPINQAISFVTAGAYSTFPGEKAFTQALSNALGSAVSHFDAQVGAFWHGLTTIVSEVAGFVFDTTILLGYLAYYLSPAHLAVIVANHVSGFLAQVDKADHVARHALHRATHALHIAQSVASGDFALPRTWLRDVEKALAPEFRTTRDLAKSAEADASNAWTWIRKHGLQAGTIAFTGAVAVALSSLGLAGIRCTNFKNLLRKFGCGLGTLLDDLLGLAIAGIALEGVCEFLPEIEAAFGAIAGPMVHVLNEVPLGACETVPDGWAALSVVHGPLPPRQTLGRLAA